MRSSGKIMEATLEVIAEHGFDGVTIAGVSAAAGVSRQTVYSIFGTREVLVTRTMEHLAVEVMTEIRSRLDGPETVRDYVVEMVIGGRRAVRDIPAMGALLRLNGINPVLHPDVVQHAIPVVRDLLSPLTALDPRVAEVLDDIVLITTRLGLSVVLFDDPSIADDDDLRAFLLRWLPASMTVPPE
ncbi:MULTISPECIES: TetR/AcrR family transcriptional regulator [unclassified Rhodococcus (in: high G+C Gram-positive bacteria)]|jgi:AcrR family transcriptional regulator|uniref:TetR/AcrR family transcriptional regulator n=1 Tax=unclassified Rhodococcus (in: high G+C Gram-positive bacteria) TaxID=192944 RepID=UPI00047F0A2D|nr:MULTISPECIES: TetR/AcrR family transcriptional regulator [unclassified Rhodococcus (in: high G+C Gram-positive bacteria)]KQU34505.1 hypothetical protein ASG69_00465 [Rhodococcus sp. Leaf225]KQU45266.1 hypothetical protein ASH03_08025 [Rhodococcus sp. Leaf258]